MEKDLFETARRHLLSRRDEIISRREARARDEQELLALREPNWAETTTDQSLATGMEDLSEREREELEAMLAALVRMDSGTWGKCTSCGEPIDRARLLATPEVEQCLACSALEGRLAPPRALELRARESFGPLSEEGRALEEPEVYAVGDDDRPVTARPHAHSRFAGHGSATLVAEQLGRHVLEEATEAEVPVEEEPVDARLAYLPDETFPDRVGVPVDQLDEEGEPVAASKKRAHRKPRRRQARKMA